MQWISVITKSKTHYPSINSQKNTRGMGEGEVVDELWQISMQLEDQIICMLLLTSAGGSARTNWNVILQNLEAF